MFTEGEMWLDDDNFLAIGKGDDYRTVAEVVRGDFDVNVKANAKEFVRRWNSQPELLAACELGLHGLQANHKALKKTAELLGSPLSSEMQDTQNEVETFLETAIQAANAETTQNKSSQNQS